VNLYHRDALWLPMASFRHFVASTLCQIASTVLGHHWSNLRPVFFKFGRISDDVFNNYVRWHTSPLFVGSDAI
jgi:hypothetical protein